LRPVEIRLIYDEIVEDSRTKVQRRWLPCRAKGIRLQHLTPMPRGPSRAAINAALVAALDAAAESTRRADAATVAAGLAAERLPMLPLRAPAFEARKLVPVSVSRRARVKVAGAYYSVPSAWSQLDATAYVGPTGVRLVRRGETVEHPRQRARAVRSRHSLPELARSRSAVVRSKGTNGTAGGGSAT
jgi:hypothetical protein